MTHACQQALKRFALERNASTFWLLQAKLLARSEVLDVNVRLLMGWQLVFPALRWDADGNEGRVVVHNGGQFGTSLLHTVRVHKSLSIQVARSLPGVFRAMKARPPLSLIHI